MDTMLIPVSVTLVEIMCVIIVFASLFMRSRFFTEVFEHRPRLATQILLMVFFGLMSIFGTLSGLSIYGAVVNIRDLGPMAAGLLCGPYVGIGAGIIGGLFRFAQGGPYMWTGLSAPLLSGILGGILYLANRKQFVPVWAAVLYIGLSETLISCYTLILVTKPAQFSTVLTDVAIPMIVYNVLGMVIFATVVHQIMGERKTEGAMRLMELELESRRNLSTVINTIAYPVYVLDRNHRFTLVNDSFSRFVSRPPEEIYGRGFADLFSAQDSSYFRWMSEDVFLGRAIHEKEATVTKPGGQVSTIVTTPALYTGTTGDPFVVGVIQDISERKKMQTALAENEAWYRILFEHTGAATVILDADGVIDQANSEFLRLTGYPRDEVEGVLNWKEISHPDDLDMVTKYHRARRIDPASAPAGYTVRVHDRAGNTRTLHAVVALIPGTDKSIASYVDISEQKRVEDALTLVNRKLNLLSSITRHDILNQLMILKGYLSLMRVKTQEPAFHDFIDRSTAATRNIEDQIIFTRDYQSMGVKAPAWQNIQTSIVMAKGALHTDHVDIGMEIPDIDVYADPLFEKVFFNLIDNSLRYGGEGMRTIRISSQEQDKGVVITYRDDGAGISDADRPRLFERGFGKHTGLGLFLSREILSITGISIREAGTEGQGARFDIVIPQGAWRPAVSVPQG